MKKNPVEENINRYKRYRNNLNLLIKLTKTNYYKQKIRDNKNNSKNIWTCVKDMCCDKIKNEITEIEIEGGAKIMDSTRPAQP